MSQVVYDINQAMAFAGMKADAQFDVVESAQAENAIAFGLGVVAGTNKENQVKIPSGSGDIFRGIALHIHKEPVGGVSQYGNNDMVNVLRKGRAHVSVEASSNIAIGDTVRLIHTGVDAGKFTAATTGSMAISGAAFASAYASGGVSSLVLLDVNLP